MASEAIQQTAALIAASRPSAQTSAETRGKNTSAVDFQRAAFAARHTPGAVAPQAPADETGAAA